MVFGLFEPFAGPFLTRNTLILSLELISAVNRIVTLDEEPALLDL